jgi:hypothetical protein
MTKLWLAKDEKLQKFCSSDLHLFQGTEPPTFDEGYSQTNDNCEYIGEVSAASVRGVHPKPGTSVEAVLLLKGCDS